MAVITPQTDVYLLKVPLEIDSVNQLTFSNATAQFNYFNALPKLAVDDFTYQRKDGTIRYGANFDDLISYNYVMYRNDAYSNKWFYAYIDHMEYLNDNVTAISIKTDVWQTWQFDLNYKRTFVEREHVNDDTRGLHTVPENLELGEYIKNSITGTPQIGPSTMWYGVGISDIVGNLTNYPSPNVNGLPNGLYYIFTDAVSVLHNIVQMYNIAGKSDAIYSMFVFPKMALYVRQGDTGTYAYQASTWSYTNGTFSTTFDVNVPTSNSNVGTLVENRTISVPTTVGMTYTPKNKKLLTFPYCYFNISNNCGTTVTYHYEDFDGSPNFNLEGIINVGCSTKLYPTNYKNMNHFTGDVQDNPYEYGITGGKYPTISWNSDCYTNWLTQNAINIGLGAISTGLSSIANFAGGNIVGGAGNLLSGIGSTVNQVYKASLMPDQAKGNTNVGDLNFSKHLNKFTVFELSIKPEYAQIIDDYFSMFGYKVNRVKVPNITGRRNWNYVKTIGCYIEADIPQEDLQEIKNLFDNGVTFWHNPATFADYSQNNDII